MNPAKKLAGAALATAAATLFLSGCATGTGGGATASAEKVHCMGVNACKGQAFCATANNSCKGHNACKGKGFVPMTKEECDSAGGYL